MSDVKPSQMSLQEIEALFRGALSQGCIALVGSGPMRRIYGNWDDLIVQLRERMKFSGDLPKRAEEAAEAIKNSNPSAFESCLRDIFRGCEYVPRLYRSILRAGFHSVLTTNYDQALTLATATADVAPDRFKKHYKFPSLPAQEIGKYAIFHIHGAITESENRPNIILTSSEFNKGYANDSATLGSFFEQALIYNSTCFIGYSFSERTIRELFKKCQTISASLDDRPDGKPKNFAFIEREEWMQDSKKRDFDDHNILPLVFDRVDEHFSGLRLKLDELTDQPSPARNTFSSRVTGLGSMSKSSWKA